MWDIERYISLVMGEIPRLLEDANGYGPNGRHYIAHVDIHEPVLKEFDELKEEYGDLIRVANPCTLQNRHRREDSGGSKSRQNLPLVI
jgi:hypothetical protein